MATIPILDSPKNLTMMNFKSISDNYGGLAKANRFAAVIKPQGQYVSGYSSFARDLTYLCEIADMPGRNFYYYTGARYYGPGFNVMFMSDYQDFNMSFVCRSKSLERQFFDDWMTIINPVNTYDFNYRDDYKAEIDIFQFSETSYSDNPTAPEAEYKITIFDAYPVMIQPQPMSWEESGFQKLVVTFTCTKWYRKGIDPAPRVGVNGYSYSLVDGRRVTR